MKRKKLAAFGLVIALTVSSSSAAFAAAVPAASNMETTAVQQMNQAGVTARQSSCSRRSLLIPMMGFY